MHLLYLGVWSGCSACVESPNRLCSYTTFTPSADNRLLHILQPIFVSQVSCLVSPYVATNGVHMAEVGARYWQLTSPTRLSRWSVDQFIYDSAHFQERLHGYIYWLASRAYGSVACLAYPSRLTPATRRFFNLCDYRADRAEPEWFFFVRQVCRPLISNLLLNSLC